MPSPAGSFRRAVEQGDLPAALALFHPQVEFRSPAVHAPCVGVEPVGWLLGHVAEVLEDFRYVDQLSGDGTHGLVFRARVGSREVEGWDHLTTDDDGLITTGRRHVLGGHT